MSKNYFSFLLLFFWSFGGLSAQVSSSDLIERISYYDVDSYRSAIHHLMKTYPGDYQPGDNWQAALAELEMHRSGFVQALQNGDESVKKKVSSLLYELDAALLANPLIQGKKVVAVRRNFHQKARGVVGAQLGLPPSNFRNNSGIEKTKTGWDNQFVMIRADQRKVQLTILYTPPEGMIISDPEPHFDGERLMYSSIGTSDRWHLFELDIKTGTTRQLTPDTYKDFDSFDGCYTPGGKYIFCSTGTFLGLPCTNGKHKMCGLFSYDPTTGKTRQLTFDQDSNWGPVMMEQGTVLYQRWEYADLPHSNSRLMFTMNPDGTCQSSFYGSNSYFPTAFFNARPIPGSPSCIVGIATGHHSVSRSGRMMVIDTHLGRHEADGVVAEIPFSGRKVEPLVRDRFPDGVWPQFLHPYPLSEDYFLVSMKNSPSSLWGIYLVDRFDNRTLLAAEEGVAYLEPVLLEPQKWPANIPDRVDLTRKDATVFLQDIYTGDGLKGIPRGTVRKLRIGSYDFSPLKQGGLLGTIGMDGPWDIKRILGEVEVEKDGSAMFTVPANTPIFLQPLDAEGKALQVMRSWFTAMPGEILSCVGCHEDKNIMPVPRVTLASRAAPRTIQEWYGKERGFSFRHEIQPVLDRYCISCHQNGDDSSVPYLKGDQWIKDWKSQIGGRANSSFGGHFTRSYTDLHRYVRRPGIESDMHMLVPMDVHADQTELMQILQKGHHNVQLDRESLEKLACWIDFNAPFHGRRSDIPNYPDTREGKELRALYREMFGAPEIETEWLPEIPQGIVRVVPKELPSSPGDTVLRGWPLYDPEHVDYGGWTASTNAQVSLGYIQKSIDLGNGVKLEMVKVPAGAFIMGSDRHPDEQPRTVVQIRKAFWIGRFEITNEQYRQFDPSHDSRDEHRHGYQFGRKGYSMNGEQQPVVRVSWQEAMNFCKWLSEKTGLEVTLPTEAQWEWACRAGSDTPYWFGRSGADFSTYANLGDIKLKEFAACTSYKRYESARIIPHPNRYDDWIPRDTTFNDGGFISVPVGSYQANPWDLHDMHGNVWEWTRSMYRSYPYVEDDGRNDLNQDQEKRVARGGSWYDRPYRTTSSFRLPYRQYQKVYNVGFRVVIVE